MFYCICVTSRGKAIKNSNTGARLSLKARLFLSYDIKIILQLGFIV